MSQPTIKAPRSRRAIAAVTPQAAHIRRWLVGNRNEVSTVKAAPNAVVNTTYDSAA